MSNPNRLCTCRADGGVFTYILKPRVRVKASCQRQFCFYLSTGSCICKKLCTVTLVQLSNKNLVWCCAGERLLMFRRLLVSKNHKPCTLSGQTGSMVTFGRTTRLFPPPAKTSSMLIPQPGAWKQVYKMSGPQGHIPQGGEVPPAHVGDDCAPPGPFIHLF